MASMLSKEEIELFKKQYPQYVCPLTKEIMRDPVIAADGRVYEREAIKEWLETHSFSPTYSGEITDSGRIIESSATKHAIELALDEFAAICLLSDLAKQSTSQSQLVGGSSSSSSSSSGVAYPTNATGILPVAQHVTEVELNGKVPNKTVEALPQHVTRVGVQPNVPAQTVAALQHVTRVELYGNLPAQTVEALPQHVTWVDIGSNLSVEAVKALPKHVTRVDLHSKVPAQTVAALPEHLTLVVLNGNVSVDAVKALPLHVTRPMFNGNLSFDVVKALPKHLTRIGLNDNLPQTVLAVLHNHAPHTAWVMFKGNVPTNRDVPNGSASALSSNSSMASFSLSRSVSSSSSIERSNSSTSSSSSSSMTNPSSFCGLFSQPGLSKKELELRGEGLRLVDIIWAGEDESVRNVEGEKVKSKMGQELETYVQELNNCLNGSKSNSSLQK